VIKKLRLFVWHQNDADPLEGCPGVMFALAHDVAEARRLINPSGNSLLANYLRHEPDDVCVLPMGFQTLARLPG
jgi:hypothetical protein